MQALKKLSWPERYLAGGHILLAVCLAGCLMVVPHYFFSFDQGGVSNYGTDPRTVGLFVAGFGAAVLGVVLAAVALLLFTGMLLEAIWLRFVVAPSHICGCAV